jgi:hypothetical protein
MALDAFFVLYVYKLHNFRSIHECLVESQRRDGISSRVLPPIRHHLHLDTGFPFFVRYGAGSRHTSPVGFKDRGAPIHRPGVGEPSLDPK